MDVFGTLSPQWFWLSLGVLLAAAELVAPGFFLIWLALAAFATGLVAFVLPIGFPLQVGLFSVLAVVAVYGARRWLVNNPIISDDPLLNNRGGRMVGEIVTVAEAIRDGHGRVKFGDSVWSAKGPDLAVGSRARIISADGSVLTVDGV